MEHLAPVELAAWLGDSSRPAPLLLDVREQWEYERACIAGSVLIPMSMIVERIDDVTTVAQTTNSEGNTDANTRAIVCICHHGARSLQVANFLERQGFAGVLNLTGGIHRWSMDVDSTVPVY